ncbi:MAG: RagB/SusD family nutrient uptake outer membrane protein [Phycisphaerales bacterium]|nr:RagB/SusD family nutrient uptake outer membrane protein [Phycisphaerales bacterium]
MGCLTILLLIGTGCSKLLDLPPENVFTQDEILNSPNGALALLSDAYFKAQNATVADNDGFGTGGLAYVIGDFATTIADINSSSVYNYFYAGAMLNTNTSAASIWGGYYSSINECNLIINQLPNSTGVPANLKSQYIAEAKFVRAFNYFSLLKLYGNGALSGNLNGLGVILRLQEYEGYSPSDNLPRSTNAQVYSQILKDLSSAASVLANNPDPSNTTSFRYRAQRVTCYALANRVALYMRDWSNAIAYSDSVFNNLSSNYILESSPFNVFPNNAALLNDIPISSEVIFTFPISYNSNLTAIHNVLYYFKTVIWADANFVNSYRMFDIRKDSMFFAGSPFGPEQLVCPTKFSSNGLRDNAVILRLAEVYLNKAEALVQSTQAINSDAIDLLNMIHQRAFPTGYKPLPYTINSFASSTALLDTILQERTWELAFEGHDFFDKIRYNKAPNPNLNNPNKWVFPIPQGDIIFNKNLVQNPGY